jgi:unconventional prefoldin RPB5 interactor 1
MEQARKDQDEFSPQSALVPEDEDEDDARLRREMLEYSQQEIGPIVAELELDEGATDDDDYEFEYTDEEDDDEDELGRSKHSVITPDYVKRMQELEKRLGVESAFATERAVPKNELNVEGLGRITVQTPSNRPPEVITEVTEITEAENKPKAKKGVRFAAELDIADEATPPATLPERPAEKKKPEVNPISDAITQRPISDVVTERPSKPVSAPVAEPAKKASRFKKDRTAGTAVLPPTPLDAPVRFLDQERKVAPSGPEGKTMADAVAERDVSTQPIEPDELDATLLHQEAAAEYHKMRNRFIQKQGGFAKEEERAITPLDELEEEEGGGKKRMSRFKAARLQRQGL